MDIIVSGTSRGIGKAIVRKFLKKGHTVYGVDIRKASIKHARYTHFICDVRDGEFPKVDAPQVVISCAGTLEEKEAIDVNLMGNIRFIEQYKESPKLKSVLIIASASARNGSEFPMYVVSKAGLVGYMKNLTLSLGERGITCNSISPGGVITHANDHILQSKKLYRQVLAESLLGKWAMPEEIADLAYFLTVKNRSITGEDILIDNGEMIKSNFIW